MKNLERAVEALNKYNEESGAHDTSILIEVYDDLSGTIVLKDWYGTTRKYHEFNDIAALGSLLNGFAEEFLTDEMAG